MLVRLDASLHARDSGDGVQLKAVRLIRAADVILYDDLGAEVSSHSPDDAKILRVSFPTASHQIDSLSCRQLLRSLALEQPSVFMWENEVARSQSRR